MCRDELIVLLEILAVSVGCCNNRNDWCEQDDYDGDNAHGGLSLFGKFAFHGKLLWMF